MKQSIQIRSFEALLVLLYLYWKRLAGYNRLSAVRRAEARLGGCGCRPPSSLRGSLPASRFPPQRSPRSLLLLAAEAGPGRATPARLGWARLLLWQLRALAAAQAVPPVRAQPAGAEGRASRCLYCTAAPCSSSCEASRCRRPLATGAGMATPGTLTSSGSWTSTKMGGWISPSSRRASGPWASPWEKRRRR